LQMGEKARGFQARQALQPYRSMRSLTSTIGLLQKMLLS
jgi:hypothetical protein